MPLALIRSFSKPTETATTLLARAALFQPDLGSANTAIGDVALANNDSSGLGLGNSNTAVGAGALFSNVDGDSNNAVGFNALGSNADGLFNNVIGFDAMADNVSGAGNVAVGDSAGAGVEGDFNIYIGAFQPALRSGPISESETIRIGDAFNVAAFVGGVLVCQLPATRLRRWKRPARRLWLRPRLCRQTSCSNSKALCRH